MSAEGYKILRTRFAKAAIELLNEIATTKSPKERT